MRRIENCIQPFRVHYLSDMCRSEQRYLITTYIEILKKSVKIIIYVFCYYTVKMTVIPLHLNTSTFRFLNFCRGLPSQETVFRSWLVRNQIEILEEFPDLNETLQNTYHVRTSDDESTYCTILSPKGNQILSKKIHKLFNFKIIFISTDNRVQLLKCSIQILQL